VPLMWQPRHKLLGLRPRALVQAEARWLEVPDAALLLEAVRTYRPARPDLALPFLYPLVATYLLKARQQLCHGRARGDLSKLSVTTPVTTNG
jgi:hypothetical protein